jgi:hypothetical protein
VNIPLLKLLASGVSQRRAALILGVHRVTIERKFLFLARRCRQLNVRELSQLRGRVRSVQIDDLITKENSKLKPLLVSIAVDADRRIILGAEVAQIPAFGHLAKLAVKKYGYRKDEHPASLDRLIAGIKPYVISEVRITSDKHHSYPLAIGRHLPLALHETFLSERACVAGQGELKKVRFDPLFVVNHTCAMLRANINRLVRKTWCTTKDRQRLQDHIEIFRYFYNRAILQGASTPFW